jgi:transglutaminase-like putative cysteine protease
MEFTIEHTTTYAYPDPVTESYTVVHLQPHSDADQFCRHYELDVTPRARVLSYVDRFGNMVQHFAILPTHERLTVTARSNVTTTRALETTGWQPLEATRARLDADLQFDTLWDFVRESPYVHFSPHLAEFLDELPGPGDAIGAWCKGVCSHIHDTFTYDKDATSVRTEVDAALVARAGVCQDFAHVMIAAVRSAGIPARYVSGDIFNGNADASTILGADASHAWCEAYLPPYGWVGFDPTNDLIVNGHFVKVAIGRDYKDVSPVRGVYRGSARAEMSVNVALEDLQSNQ